MKPTTRIALATSAAVCATLFSFGWSEQRGVSLSVEDAQARVGRPWTPVSAAGVARRHYRRAAYGYGVAGAAAIGTGAAVASSPYYTGTGCYAGDPFCNRPGVVGARAAYYGGATEPYYRPGVWGARAAYYGAAPAATTEGPAWNITTAYRAGGPWYGYSGWEDYRARNGIVCTPGTWVTADSGRRYPCQ
jgi:hypothetical protein